MVREKQLLSLIADIHKAALNFASWQPVQEALCEMVRGNTSMLAVFDTATYIPGLYSTTNIDAADWSEYQQHYRKQDLWLEGGKSMAPGLVMGGEEMVPDKILYSSEFYNDFLKHVDINRLLTIALAKNDNYQGFLCIHRATDECFDADDKQLAELLAPHLVNAIAVNLRLQALESRLSASWNVFERLPVGVFVLDRDATVLEMNQAARRMLAANDGLTLDKGRLHTTMRNQADALQLLLRSATGNGSLPGPGGSMKLQRPSMKRPWAIQISPIPAQAGTECLNIRQPSPAAMVMVTDTDEDKAPPESLLIQLYRLTRAEARLAAQLVAGNSLKQAAEHLDISIHTVRNQLKGIFRKTHTRRQTELIKLLSSTLAFHHGPAGD